MSANTVSASEAVVSLWRGPGSLEPQSAAPEERMFQLATAVGPRWIRGSNPTLHSVAAVHVWKLTPLLRELVALPHIVGVAEIAGDMVWLVDPARFSPATVDVNTSAEIAV
jgi:hypothetical protein